MRYTIQVTVTVDADTKGDAERLASKAVQMIPDVQYKSASRLHYLDAEVITEALEPTEDEAWDAIEAAQVKLSMGTK